MGSIVLSSSQETACDAFRAFIQDPEKKEFLLSGPAGTGKSFLTNYMLDVVKDEHELVRLIKPGTPSPRFHYTATTNKAAGVLGNMTGGDAKTIHSALGLTIRNNFKTGKVSLQRGRGEAINLNEGILIVDESSMVNWDLLQWIQKAQDKHRNCKILYIGDSYQLPPVNEDTCPIFQQIQDQYHLVDIHRQAAGSPIIQLSQGYRKCLDDPTQAWPEVVADNTAIFTYSEPKAWRKVLRDHYTAQHEPDDLRILAWTNDRVGGYNSWLRTQLGYGEHPVPGEVVLSNSTLVLDSGRVLAATDSRHTIQEVDSADQCGIAGYKLSLVSAEGAPLSVFQPKDWNEARMFLKKLARAKDWPEYFGVKNSWADMRPIHTQTVHKSQGSTYKKVFIDVTDIGKNSRWTEVARLMYVAITRASDEVHIFGQLPPRPTAATAARTAQDVLSSL
ncbi:hypothetical protein DRO66_06965 [Candidatus Bathyarchaeota archaeon]|nr:MAG: hypothetical protein DRO66_06965 [Candidatus Bathyarchaeota archaeon]